MFGNAFTGWHALIILLVILLLFGAPKLPALARSLGQSMKILRTEVRSDKTDEAAPDATAGTTDQTASTPEKPKAAGSSTDSGPSS